MAITLDDFNKIWASTSPLTPYSFSDANYKEGWNFVGATPPSRQMWDFLQKNNDEKMQYLADNYLPLSGGTMTGTINYTSTNNNNFYVAKFGGSGESVDVGWNYSNGDGALLFLRSKSYQNQDGCFGMVAKNGTSEVTLLGTPTGTLTWGGKNVERVNASGTDYIRYESGLQICWGTATPTSGVCNITFPLAFVNGYYTISAIGRPASSGAGAGRCVSVNGTTTRSTDMSITITDTNNAVTGTTISWLAIGYWK